LALIAHIVVCFSASRSLAIANDLNILGFKECFKESLNKDIYRLEIRLGALRYWREQILSNRVEFGNKGVVHEFVQAPQEVSSEVASGLFIEAGSDGARSRNPNKHHDEASIMEKALETETGDFLRARYLFYLGRSWMMVGEREKEDRHEAAAGRVPTKIARLAEVDRRPGCQLNG
jgi:hypothetical protein